MKCIAIDGPSGAGKSTIAKCIAKKLGYTYIDTGALYRGVALHLIKNDVDISDTRELIYALNNIDIKIDFVNDDQQIYLNGENVTDDIRMPNISIFTSKISTIGVVREYLLKIQKDISTKADVIMDGRDIGTVVFPNADVKIFLTASLEERSRRRYDQLSKKGIETTYEKVFEDMKVRDDLDCTRDISPLAKAEDAVYVETTGNELNKSIEIITNIIKERL